MTIINTKHSCSIIGNVAAELQSSAQDTVMQWDATKTVYRVTQAQYFSSQGNTGPGGCISMQVKDVLGHKLVFSALHTLATYVAYLETQVYQGEFIFCMQVP